MSVEDSKKFRLSVLNFYASVSIAADAASSAVEETVREEEAYAAGYSTGYAAVYWTARQAAGYHESLQSAEMAAGEVARYAAAEAAEKAVGQTTTGWKAREEVWEAARVSTTSLVLRGAKGTWRQIAEACCRSVLSHRKEIKENVRKVSWDNLPATLLSSEQKVQIIRKLITYDGKCFERLRKTIPLQLHRICFDVECLIKVDAGFAELAEPAEEKMLMAEHRQLVKKLGMKDSYAQLFVSRPLPRESLTRELQGIIPLPRVLIEIVNDYLQLSCHDEEDVEEIFRRILALPNTAE